MHARIGAWRLAGVLLAFGTARAGAQAPGAAGGTSGGGAGSGAQPAGQPAAASGVDVTFSWRTRAERCQWFDVAGGAAGTAALDGEFGFVGSILRLGATGRRPGVAWTLEGAVPALLGLPDDAIAPPPSGQLGLGAAYHAANDRERNVVSLTSSVGVLFGSGVYAEGIFLNSSGNLFARGERAPRRRPGSGIAPTLVLDARQRPRYAAGAGGAAYIVPAVSQVLLRMIGLGQDPWTAVQAPRLQPAAASRALELEQGFALPVYGALRAHGYLPVNRVSTLQFAGVHALAVREDGTIVGAADPRRDGAGEGY